MKSVNDENVDFDTVIFQLEGSGMWETQEILRKNLALCEKAVACAKTIEHLDQTAPLIAQGIDNADIFENGTYFLEGFMKLDAKCRAKIAKMEG